MPGISRRELLTGTAVFVSVGSVARAGTIAGALPWRPDAGAPPEALLPGSWTFFTGDEGAAIEALADRVIPPDPDTPGGKDSGCAVFIDRQLSGPYGRNEGLYDRPPFVKGAKNQGPQDPTGPARRYRAGLGALDAYCRANHGAAFSAMSDSDKDAVLAGLESGSASLEGIDGKAFFEMLLKDVQEGFFADPIYGGNRNMGAWRMNGFPGARYDYREWVPRHNERFPLPPVSITGRPEWTPHGG